MADPIGLSCAGIAVVLFSLFALPTKTHAVGDGVYFQWCMCCGIWCVGLASYFIRGCPPIVPFSALGGAIWCASNCLLTVIVGAVGVGITMVAWGGVEMLTGWGTARFGFFGLRS